MDPKIQKMQEMLLTMHPHHLVSRKENTFVFEGYPRSGNTFSCDMVDVLTGKTLKMGHHVHKVENVLVGQGLGQPVVILIRDPKDAILSFMIFSGRDVAFCARMYLDFYQGVLKANDGFCFVDFDMVVTDFNAVVRKINAATGLKLPLAEDLEAASTEARNRAKARAVRVHGDKAKERVGTPTAEREKMKAAKRSEVLDYLAQHPEIDEVYKKVMALV